MKSQPIRWFLAVSALLALCLATTAAQQAGKKEYQFRGKVEKIDVKAKTLTVDGENVEGWMRAMTMNYKVDKSDTLKKVKAGDQITARVYEGDFEVLHEVQVIPAKNDRSRKP